jgi:hypothetical protein
MSPYGEGLDPFPFILSAYGVCALLLLGMSIWLFVQRGRLDALRDAIEQEETRS